ncbi:uncharacterized protein L201_002589 [Kwoniella dendrophila CBS 6074]|uniref:Uncharacterized protein n=1 Tax=Kwoniella dendrophila CBS 6074 TaxID=1295534 RepID=A0AAX4JQJ4_9TREE
MPSTATAASSEGGPSTVPSKKPSTQFLDKSDLLSPDSLTGKDFGVDYVLLGHKTWYSRRFDSIQKNGLKTLSCLAKDPNATEDTKALAKVRQNGQFFL